jgi:hypothetical protein
MFNFQRFRGSLSLIFLAALISTPILWLISYPMNYFFYLVSTLLIFFFTENFSSSYKVKVFYGGYTTIIEFMPLTVVCVLLLLNLAGLYYTTINIVLSAVIVFFMPGYVIMWLFDRSSNSVFLKLSMSFALSFVVNGFIYTFASIFTDTVFERRMVILLVYLFYFSGAYLVKRFIRHIRVEGSRNNETCRLADVLLLAIYIIIFIYAILNMYPKAAFNPGLDIVRHFSSAWVAAINPGLLKSAYPWFHFEEAMVIILSAPFQEVNVISSYMPVYQAVLAFLGVLPMASFYVMARAYLKDVDERLPVIATGFWMFFSGFGWLNLLGRIDYSTFSRLKVLGIADDKSFWDIGYGGGQSIWFWYRPLTVGFTLLFIMVYLLREEGMSKRMFMSLSIMLIVGLVFAHFSELVVFVGILSFLSIISPRILPRLHDMLLATTLGTILALLFSIVLRCCGIVFSIDYNYLIIVTLLTLLCYFLTFKWKGFHFRYSGVLAKLLSLFLLIFYASALFEWLSSMDFSVWRVSSTQFVPWLLYPVILGVIGLLAIISLSQYQQYFNKPICLFVYMFIFMIAFGKVVSFVNNNYFYMGYWERRLIVHCFAAASALAPIPLLKAYNKLSPNGNKFLVTMIIGLIVVSGMSSTFLSVEYRSSLAEQSPLSNVEMNVASFLFEALKENSMGSPIFTISDRSRGVAEFTGSYYVVGTGGRISFSEAYPERPLLNLYNWSPTPYILITNSDKPLLSSKYGGYVSSRLLRFIPKVYDDGYSEIYSLPNGTPPSLESKTILVLPGDETNTNYFFAYDVLSLSRYDYTTMLMNDPNIYKGDVIILPYDPQGTSDIDQLLGSLGDKDIIVINTNGYGAIADSLFTGSFRYTLKTNSTNTFIVLENENVKRTYLNESSLGTLAFTLRNEGGTTLTLADDEISSFWTPQATGEGTIGPPFLNNTAVTKVSGNSSLLIKVGEGRNKYWLLQHDFKQSTDWSGYDFFTFYWLGRNDSSWYVLCFYSSGGYFWYTFRDNWTGWRKVIIPLNMPDGKICLNGVDIVKATNKNATWNDVKTILFALNANNPNLGGTFYMDKISLEKAVRVEIIGAIDNFFGSVKELKLSLLQPNLHLAIKANESAILPANSIIFKNYEVDAEKLFGKKGYATIKANSSNGSLLVELSIKMPPESELGIRMEASTNAVNASAIKGVYIIKFPLNVRIEPILPRNSSNTMSFYWCEPNISVPLAVRGQYNGHRITYVNVYPLISAIQSDSEAGRKLFPLLGHLLKASGIHLPNYSENTSWLYDFTVAFRSSSFDGNITLSSSSVILEDDVTAIGYKDQNIREEFENISSISLIGEGNLNVFAHKVEMLPGRGFYSNVAVKDRQLTITGSNITAYIKLNNGSLTVIGGLKELFIYSNNNTLSAYLREPEIRVAGHATFKDFQPYNKPSFSRLRNSMTANITGTVSFNLPISDVYSWARSFTYSGDVEYDKPLVYWDEWEHMRALLPWVIVCIILLIASSLLVGSFEISKKKN